MKMMMKKKRRCSDDVSIPLQYLWCRAEKKMQQWCVSAVAIYMVKSWKRDIMCQFQCSIHGKEAEKEEKKMQSNPYAMHAKHFIIIPKDIQLTCNTHGKDLITQPKPKMNYWAWLWMTTIQQMKPSSSLLKMTSSLLIMKLKDKSKGFV